MINYFFQTDRYFYARTSHQESAEKSRQDSVIGICNNKTVDMFRDCIFICIFKVNKV